MAHNKYEQMLAVMMMMLIFIISSIPLSVIFSNFMASMIPALRMNCKTKSC